jgi:hypothetical protein
MDVIKKIEIQTLYTEHNVDVKKENNKKAFYLSGIFILL